MVKIFVSTVLSFHKVTKIAHSEVVICVCSYVCLRLMSENSKWILVKFGIDVYIKNYILGYLGGEC
jgi:hypothetical protein